MACSWLISHSILVGQAQLALSSNYSQSPTNAVTQTDKNHCIVTEVLIPIIAHPGNVIA